MTIEEEVVKLLRIPSAQEDLVEPMIFRALAVLEKELDWYFGPPRPVTEGFMKRGNYRLWLRQPPVEGFPVIAEYHLGADSWREFDPTGYIVKGRTLIRLSGWFGFMRVSYHEGFLEIPGDIKQLIIDMVSEKFRDVSVGKAGLKSESIEDYSYTKEDVSKGDLAAVSGWSRIRANWQRGRI